MVGGKKQNKTTNVLIKEKYFFLKNLKNTIFWFCLTLWNSTELQVKRSFCQAHRYFCQISHGISNQILSPFQLGRRKRQFGGASGFILWAEQRQRCRGRPGEAIHPWSRPPASSLRPSGCPPKPQRCWHSGRHWTARRTSQWFDHRHLKQGFGVR